MRRSCQLRAVAAGHQLSLPNSNFFFMACCPWYTVASMMPLTAGGSNGRRRNRRMAVSAQCLGTGMGAAAADAAGRTREHAADDGAEAGEEGEEGEAALLELDLRAAAGGGRGLS